MKNNNIDKETKFDISELFFSITDKQSTIISGNDVFIRISGYSKDDLIGHYHNIIRHPDMPKIIFKTFWDYLQSDKPIVAYVKNRSKDGGYYWVLAAVFPLNDHYISIRIKPSSPLFEAAQRIYNTLLIAQCNDEAKEQGTLLSELLSDAGYENYDQFMRDALMQELKGRKNLPIKSCLQSSQIESLSPLLKTLKSTHEYSKTLMFEYDQWFEKMDMFIQVKSLFQEKSTFLRHLARDIVFLSLNASVSSYKVEKGGETFGVLARDVRTNAKENDLLIYEIDRVVNELSSSLNDIIFAVSSMRLKIEMVTYFIEEVLCQNDESNVSQTSANMSDLISLVIEYADQSKLLLSRLAQHIQSVLKYLDQLEQQMMYLGYIQVYGFIEAAGSRDESMRFGVIFSQLKTLTEQTSKEIETMQKMGKMFYMENNSLIGKASVAEIELDKMRNDMEAIKAMIEL